MCMYDCLFTHKEELWCVLYTRGLTDFSLPSPSLCLLSVYLLMLADWKPDLYFLRSLTRPYYIALMSVASPVSDNGNEEVFFFSTVF